MIFLTLSKKNSNFTIFIFNTKNGKKQIHRTNKKCCK